MKTTQRVMPTGRQGFIAPLLMVIIAVLLMGSYVYTQNRKGTTPITTTSTVQTADWKTYTNTKYGFTFKYPASWFLYSRDGDDSTIDFSKSEITTSELYNNQSRAKKEFASFSIGRYGLGKTTIETPTQQQRQEYFHDIQTFPYGQSSVVTMKWIDISGMPVFFTHVVGDNNLQLRNTYTLFTKDKFYSFVLSAGTPEQSTTYDQKDSALIEQVIGTFSFLGASTKFINISPETTDTLNSRTADWKTYISAAKDYAISYPAVAKLDASDSSCVRIDTKEFGEVVINSNSTEPCAEPGGIGIGTTRINDTIALDGKEYPASGWRDSDYSQSFLSFSYDKNIVVTYGVGHFDKSNPRSWKSLGPLTDLEYQAALNSAKAIVATLRPN